MGMSASQVRFLSLQSRKHDIGRRLTSLSNQKMSLSRDMNRVSKNYTNALNQHLLKWSNDSGANYNTLTYNVMMKPNDLNFEKPYIISNLAGNVILDSEANLLGKKGTDYMTLTDFTFRTTDAKAAMEAIYGAGNGAQKLNLSNIARWITTATAEDGTVGQITTDKDGVVRGTANAGAYVIPKNAYSYGFEHNLRYQIFTELGLVDDSTTDEYTKKLNAIYGDETAYNYNDYQDLLYTYLGVHYATPGNDDLKLAGHDDISHITDTTSGLVGINALKINDDQFGGYEKYFGRVDNNGNWVTGTDGKVIGSLMGNLEVARLAVTEYDNWCNELKEFNLGADSVFSFTATSGRHIDQTVGDFLTMNSCVDGNMGYANDFESEIKAKQADGTDATYSDGSTIYTFKQSWLQDMAGEDCKIVNEKWSDIYAKGNSSVKLTGDVNTAGLVNGFLQGLVKSLNQGSATTGSNGDAWTFTSTSAKNKDYVKVDGQSMKVTDAASLFAVNQTVKYYGQLQESNSENGGCGSCHGKQHFYNTAAGKGQSDTDNVLGRATSGRCFWHRLTHFVGGLIHTVAGGIWTIASTVVSVGGAWGGFGMNTSALTNGWNNFSDAFRGDGAYYTLNMANVEKTYLTFYQMYMAAWKNDGINLLDGSDLANSGVAGTSTSTITDDTPFQEAAQEFDGCPTAAMTPTGVPNQYVYTGTGKPWSGMTTNKVTTTIPITNDDGTITNQSVTAYDYEVLTKGDDYMIKEKVGADEAKTTIKFKNPRTASNGQQYDKIVCDERGNISYYNGTTAVDIKKVVTSSTMEYSYTDENGATVDLKVAPRGTKFANKVYAYITPSADFKKKLKDDIDSAQKAIDDAMEDLKDFSAGKNNKLMEFYDALFNRIAQEGWVEDNKINGKSTSANYLNNKLQNNEYFVTVPDAKIDENGYQYTIKMASTVTKIYNVNDDNVQNEALSKYETEKNQISSKEKKIDLIMQKLETEQEAVNTELEAVQKVENDNIEKTFKMFA